MSNIKLIDNLKITTKDDVYKKLMEAEEISNNEELLDGKKVLEKLKKEYLSNNL